jgi:hypothetical protein
MRQDACEIGVSLESRNGEKHYMQILKTLALLSDLRGDAPCVIDTIVYRGLLWLVPEWVHHSDPARRTPRRLICLSVLYFQETPDGLTHFVLPSPVPKTILYGGHDSDKQSSYVVVEGSDIELPSTGMPQLRSVCTSPTSNGCG